MARAVDWQSVGRCKAARPVLWTLIGLVAWLLAGGVLADRADAAELIMFEDAGCSWCRKFDREIGPIYPKTEEGRRAPLRRINIARAGEAGVSLAKPVNATPTFVLADNGVEVGRITGYPGEDFFWGLLGEQLGKLPRSATGVPRLRDASFGVFRLGHPDGKLRVALQDGACVERVHASVN